jgi:GTP pyrophosphokinase
MNVIEKNVITEEIVDEKFKQFLKNCYRCKTDEKQKILKKAYQFAKIAHSGQTRYNGDAFINHPLEVAKIVTLDIGLGTTSAVVALLHDTITNTDVEIQDIELSFGKEIAKLVESLAKIKGTSTFFNINKSEVYKRLLVGIAEDIRIIYIKIADRLHNMRTLETLEPEQKYQVASETMYVYAPLAVRLGIYKIKTELEDLAFKYLDPHNYNKIANQIKDSEFKNIMYLNKVSLPIIAQLRKQGFEFKITSRQKSVYSIWQKIKRKGISFREIYDLFAIRIIFEPRKNKNEKQECFEIKKIIENIYEIKKDRTRDWITNPKPNGYEALHVTILGPQDRWVEIQIRSQRMHDIAKHGFASHWAYKGLEYKKIEFDEKIQDLKRKLEKVENDDFDYLSNFKLLFSTEIVTYTPKGREIILPVGATALDFAFYVHSKMGYEAIAAKVNNILVPLDYILQNGDYVYIITSKRQEPKTQWLRFVKTNKAKNALEEYFGIHKINEKELGMRMLHELLKKFDITPTPEVFKYLISSLKTENKHQLYIKIGSREIQPQTIANYLKKYSKRKINRFFKITTYKKPKTIDNSNFVFAKCCNPIPGDEVIAIIKEQYTEIHRKNCPKLTQEERTNPFNLSWKLYADKSFYTKIEIEAENRKGLFFDISKVLAQDMEVNVKSIYIDTLENEITMFGWIEIYILNSEHLNKIIEKLLKIDGVERVSRLFN